MPSWQDLLRLLIWGPLLEEWLMRANVQAWLQARQCRAQVLLPALLFSGLHLHRSPWTAVAVFVPGLLFGEVYRRWSSWWLCAALHGISNALAIAACMYAQH